MRLFKPGRQDLMERSRRLLCKLNFSTPKKATNTDNKSLFCSKPFKWFEVFSWNEVGQVYLCCAGWLDISIGNLRYQSVEEIWNSEKAQEIRNSILDGSFKFCDQSLCPYLQTASGPVSKVEDVTDKDLRFIIKNGLRSLPYGPRAINCSYDKSCNLSCPSCRTEIIIEGKNEKNILDIQSKIQNEALKDAHLLYMSGIGDPFGSPFSKKWLQTMKREDMPNLREIFLQTNAQLWTPQIWSKIPKNIQQLVKSTEISIDAATSETYSINRRGGSFEKLLANLNFISQLRKNGPLKTMRISMVVQENNFGEMPDFINLGKSLNVDTVFFTQLVNWGTFSDEEFSRRAIHLPAHPRHSEFASLLNDKIFNEPIVHLGNLTNFTYQE